MSASSQATPAPPNPSPLARLVPVLVLGATFLAYAAVPKFEFVYDDESQIVHDLFVQQWRFVPAYFNAHVWQWVYPHVTGNYYRPLFLLWMLLNFKAFGLHPALWHLAVVALHLLVTWQVYRLAMRLLSNPAAAAAAALVFGLHPVHLESVAWVSGATEPLAAAFILGSVLSWMRYRESGGRADYAWSLLWFACALFTKEPAVLVPAFLFIYDMLFSRGEQGSIASRGWESIRKLALFVAVIGAYIVARVHALHIFGQSMYEVSLRANLLTIPSLLAFYGRMLVWPFGLSAFYDNRYISTLSDAALPLLLCAVVALAAAWGLVRTRSRVAAFALVLLLLPLAPLMKLSVFVRGEIAHDRYLYLPSVGFVLLVGLLYRRLDERSEALRKLATGSTACVAVVFFGATMWQSLYWADNLVLYARGAAIAPDNLIVLNDLANEWMKRGRGDAAIAQYRDVLRRDPLFWLARYNLAYAEYSSGDCAAAARDFEVAGRQNPGDPETSFYLGDCRFRLGDHPTGIALMRRGIDLDPRMPNFRAKLADALVETGEPQNLRQALDLYRAEAIGNPGHPYAAARAAELEKRLAAGN